MFFINWLQLIVLLNTLVSSLTIGDNSSSKYISDETELLKTLMKGYDRRARPVLSASDQVNVSLSMKMLTLQEVNTRDQYISVIGWINVRWKEERFGWNDTENNVKYLSIPPNEVWLPNFVLSNSVDDTFYKDLWYRHYQVKIHPNGRMGWNPGGKFKAHCTIDITYFPFDDQVCEFLFENWVHLSRDVNLTYTNNAENVFDQTDGVENEQWQYIGIKVYRHDSAYTKNSAPYPKVYFKIHLKRKPLYYIYSFILQNVFLNGLVLSIFKLPAESGERVSMGVTIFLAISVLLLYIADSIPTASTSIPIINYYLIFVIILTSLAVIETVVVLYLFDHKANHPPPKWLQKINGCFLEPCLSCLCRKCQHRNTSNTAGIDHQTDCSSANKNQALKPVVFINDRFDDINDNEEHRDEAQTQGARNGDLLTVKSSTLLRHSGGAYLVSSRNSQLIAENSDEGENMAAWRHISRNIDRLCFRLFSVMFTLLILISLIIVPYGYVNKTLDD